MAKSNLGRAHLSGNQRLGACGKIEVRPSTDLPYGNSIGGCKLSMDRDAGGCEIADLEDADGGSEQHTWRKWRKEESAN